MVARGVSARLRSGNSHRRQIFKMRLSPIVLGTGIKVGPGMWVERLNTTLKIGKASTQSTQSLLQIAIVNQ